MKIVGRKTSLRLVLQWIQRALFAGAILMLGYCAFVLVDAWWFERSESRNLDHARPELPGEEAPLRIVLPSRETSPRGMIGRIEIARLGLSAIIVEGTDGKSLRRAVGHIAGT